MPRRLLRRRPSLLARGVALAALLVSVRPAAAQAVPDTDPAKLAGTWRLGSTRSLVPPSVGFQIEGDIEFVTFADSGRLVWGSAYKSERVKTSADGTVMIDVGSASGSLGDLFSRSKRPPYYATRATPGTWQVADSAGIPVLCVRLTTPPADPSGFQRPDPLARLFDGCRPYRFQRGRLEWKREKWERLAPAPGPIPRPTPKITY